MWTNAHLTSELQRCMGGRAREVPDPKPLTLPVQPLGLAPAEGTLPSNPLAFPDLDPTGVPGQEKATSAAP